MFKDDSGLQQHYYYLCSVLFLGSLQAFAEGTASQQATNQREQQAARREQLATPSASIKSTLMDADTKIVLSDESPCYPIDRVTIERDNKFPTWLPFNDLIKKVTGKCLGKKGLMAFSNAIQNRIISHGFITSRVIFPSQDLKSRTLKIKIISGIIEDIKFKKNNDDFISLFNNVPAEQGNILDLRDLEQGVENLQRIPGSRVNFQLFPGKTVGGTEVEITRSQTKHWRLGAWVDDSGSKYTGRYQAGATLYLDNISSLNDMFYASFGGGLKNEDGKRTDNSSFYYSLPWGYQLLEFYASKNRYTQTLSSQGYRYHYLGDERYLNAKISRVVYRSARQKTTFGWQLQHRAFDYYLNDVEIEVQKRNTTAWQLSLDHKIFLDRGTFEGGISYQRAEPWAGDKPDAEELSGMADNEARIIRLHLDAGIPFSLFGQVLSYEPHLLGQMTPDRLTEPDKFAIGNRWTVRGFDGETNLTADKGWYWRNDLKFNATGELQPYIGLDYGRVTGNQNDYWSGEYLMGSVVGLRGARGDIGFDLFIGAPLHKPDNFTSSDVVSGFTLQWQY